VFAVASGQQLATPIFSKGELNVTDYRIPVLLAVPVPNAAFPALLAFAEARLPCVQSCGGSKSWGDAAPKHIAFRRSVDLGKTWSPTRFILKSNGTNDNLNLGNAVYDTRSSKVILQWGGCVHCSCSGTTPKPKNCKDPSSANAMQLTSTDAGLSFDGPTDISSQILSTGSITTNTSHWPIFKFGEGSGLQTKSGDLVVCGRISSLGSDACPSNSMHAKGGGGNCGSACIISSDGGEHWQRGGHFPSGSECEPALLRNCSIVLNMRAGTDRYFARSDDGGRSFVRNWTLASSGVHDGGIGPIADCQGSMIGGMQRDNSSSDHVLYMTIPFGSSARQNLSLVASGNGGDSWAVVRPVHSGPSAYSSLARVHSQCAALLFEGGEALALGTNPGSDSDYDSHRYDHIYFTTLGACGQQLREGSGGQQLHGGSGGHQLRGESSGQQLRGESSGQQLREGSGPAAPFFKAVTEEEGFGPQDNGTIVIGHEKAAPLNITGIEGSFYTKTSDGQVSGLQV
jgi:sialidase-1